MCAPEIMLPHLCQTCRKTTEEKMTNDQLEGDHCILLLLNNYYCQSRNINSSNVKLVVS